MRLTSIWLGSLALVSLAALAGCASAPPVQTEAYARLSNHKTFEYEFPVVWKGIEETFRNYRVVDRDPDDVDEIELKRLTKRTLETDWIYGQSRDKYEEYTVNGSPRRKYLQTRFKFRLIAATVLGGTDVTVQGKEEIERLNSDGTSAGFERSQEPDSSRLNEILQKIQNAILSAAP